MKNKRLIKMSGGICLVLMIGILSFIPAFNNPVSAQVKKEIKVGVGISITGGFAPAGSLRVYRGLMTAIDMVNARGGILGEYIIKPIVADYQSSPDVALREIERLINVERVPIIVGCYSSGIAVPASGVCERNKTIFFITNAISDAVLKGKHYNYVFRYNRMGSQDARVIEDFLSHNYGKMGIKGVGEIKMAIINEDGPYGTSVWKAHEGLIKEFGMKLALHESYPTDIKDMSSIILKIKASDQNIVQHAGYFPDTVLFWKQGRLLGLKTRAIIGTGATYCDYPTLEEAVGKGVADYVMLADNPPAQMIPRAAITPEAGKLVDEFLSRVLKQYGDKDPSTHYTDGCFHTWAVYTHVIPLALKKYGEITPDTMRKAFLEVDVPPQADPRGWGCKFAPPDHEFSGQNLKAVGTLLQWVKGVQHIAWPKSLQTAPPKFPLPSDSPFAK